MTLEKPAGTASKLGTYELLKEQPGIGVGATWVARSAGDTSEAPQLFSVLRVHKHLTKKADAIEAFTVEATPAAGFKHPNVAGLLEIGNEAGELYVVSEHHDGETLTGLAAAAGAQGLPQSVVLRVALDVLAALTAAHTHDPPLCHGELGPHHVLVGDDGVGRLGGLLVGRALSRLTPPVGAKNHDRLSYAAPERVKTLGSPTPAPATPVGDVFSMGVILWEALSHQRLFTSKIEAAIVQKLLTAPITPLTGVAGVSVDAPLA
jgi:eukaryotic-like serine/threonine-protein kinase